MKIISKYKDYYDWAVSIFGIDPNIVLHRNTHTTPLYLANDDSPRIYHIHIGDQMTSTVNWKGSWYTGKSILDTGQFYPTMNNPNILIPKMYVSKYDTIKDGYIRYYSHVAAGLHVHMEWEKSELNDIMDCPIVLGYNRDFVEKFPILQDYGVPQALSAAACFQLIYAWLSKQKDIVQNVVDTRTNVEKLESKGFDKKRSFRPTMK